MRRPCSRRFAMNYPVWQVFRLARACRLPIRMGRTVAFVWQALRGLTAAGTVADLHGIPLAKAAAKIRLFLARRPRKTKRSRMASGPPVKQRPRRISGILFPLRGDCHFSRPAVARRLKRPTLRRRTSSPLEARRPQCLYTWTCSP